MLIRLIITGLCFIILKGTVNAQFSESFVPFEIGNTYYYKTDYYGTGGQYTRYNTYRITNDAYINGKRYFYHPLYSENCVRYDSINQNYLIYYPGHACGQYVDERIIDSMRVNLYDSLYFCYSGTPKICDFSQTESLFGYNLFSVGFSSSSSVQSGGWIKYTKGIGITSYGGFGGHNGSLSTLLACKINGRVYGDTLSFTPYDTSTASFFGVHQHDRYIFESSSASKKIFISTYELSTQSQQKWYLWSNYSNAWVRFDTISGCIVRTSNPVCGRPDYFTKVDSLRAGLNDTVNYCTGLPFKVCTAYTDTTLFSVFTKKKTFTKMVNGIGLRETYAKKFSLIQFDVLDSSYNIETYSLKGAVISGVVYGDTASVFYIAPPVPVEYTYSLQQNYPNPFNPSTKIKFELKDPGNVILKLFDLNGRLITVLLNEIKNEGSHTFNLNSVEFNLPSGIYFYTLNAGEFNETRKMVLIK